MNIILCEKPSVAKAFATALNANYKNGIYQNDKYKITNCVGHLFELYMPPDYNPNFKKWNLKDLPIIPDTFKYNKIEAVEKQTNLVLKVLKETDYDKIIIATDAGREGELIARIVLQQAGFKSVDKMFRFWESAALTPEVILKGLENAKPLSEYTNLAKQSYIRQHSDWLVGVNLSRLLSISSRTPLSVGRVQTAVLYEIYKREQDIKNFKPKAYYEYIAELASSEANLKTKKYTVENGKINTKFDSPNINLSNCINKKALLENQEREEKKELPELLFNLTALQKKAFKSFGISPEKTLNIAQKLYEEYKCLSYPRTPSRVMGESNVDLVKDIFNSFKDLRPDYCTSIDESKFTTDNKRIFNDAKLEDHHALVPLKEISNSASELEKGVFELVVKQFFIAFSKPHIYEKTTVKFKIDEHLFIASGNKVIQNGWKKIASHGAISNSKSDLASSEANLDEANNFSKIDFNNLTCKNINVEKKFTSPPKLYKFDSLLSFMENPRNTDENKKLVSLGTPATRAEIIKTLITRQYICESKKSLVTKDKGVFLINQIIKNEKLHSLLDVKQTTVWEEKLLDNPVSFFNSIKEFVKYSCNTQNLKIDEFKQEKEVLGKCPVCSKEIYEGKKNYYCCGYSTGCKFVIWKNVANAKISKEDVKKLLSGKTTNSKKCKNKNGKEFTCKFFLENLEIKFKFDKKKIKR